MKGRGRGRRVNHLWPAKTKIFPIWSFMENKLPTTDLKKKSHDHPCERQIKT